MHVNGNVVVIPSAAPTRPYKSADQAFFCWLASHPIKWPTQTWQGLSTEVDRYGFRVQVRNLWPHRLCPAARPQHRRKGVFIRAEDSGQGLCTCTTEGKHADTEQIRRVVHSLKYAMFRGSWMVGIVDGCKSYWPFYSLKQVTQAWEACSFTLTIYVLLFFLLFLLLYFYFYSSISELSNYCSTSSELLLLYAVNALETCANGVNRSMRDW